MKVLFLDDMQERHDLVDQSIPANAEVTHVYTAQQAIDSIKFNNSRWDVVCLDHDLGQGHGLSDNEAPTGMEVVDYLLDLTEEKRPAIVVVHTWNAPAGDRMEEKLRQNGYRVIRRAFTGGL
jgi:coenzyme F420-reducing hydrogenase alpha subunit